MCVSEAALREPAATFWGGSDVIQRSTSRRRFGLASAAVIALLVLSTGSAAADTSPGGDARFSQTGKSADAGSGECISNGDGTTTCSFVGISVFAGKMSDSVSGVTHVNQVCVFSDSFTFSDETGELVGEPLVESGCEVDLPSGRLVFGAKLTTAKLAATTVSVQQFVCDEFSCEPGASRNVTVVGSWTGFGPTMSSKFRSTFDDGMCRYAESGKGSSREASFVGSVDGVSLGADTFASIGEGRFTFRSRCIEV